MKKLNGLALVGATMVAGMSQALAAAQDYSGVTTSITTEIAAAMPVVLAIGGILLGIGVAFRLIKRAGKF